MSRNRRYGAELNLVLESQGQNLVTPYDSAVSPSRFQKAVGEFLYRSSFDPGRTPNQYWRVTCDTRIQL